MLGLHAIVQYLSNCVAVFVGGFMGVLVIGIFYLEAFRSIQINKVYLVRDRLEDLSGTLLDEVDKMMEKILGDYTQPYWTDHRQKNPAYLPSEALSKFAEEDHVVPQEFQAIKDLPNQIDQERQSLRNNVNGHREDSARATLEVLKLAREVIKKLMTCVEGYQSDSSLSCRAKEVVESLRSHLQSREDRIAPLLEKFTLNVVQRRSGVIGRFLRSLGIAGLGAAASTLLILFARLVSHASYHSVHYGKWVIICAPLVIGICLVCTVWPLLRDLKEQ